MLALLLLFHNVAGKDTQKYVPTTHHITSCPDMGYYFNRDVIPNSIEPGPCNLCFCQDNTTAICWPRKSERCDSRRYTFNDRGKRANRSRRSPGFSDIFFRDAAREVFDKQTPQQCEPFESSISDGCPPADWCIGCTVCDCDSNGRWDCHTLSFCPDKKGKKQIKKRRNYHRNKIVKRQLPKKQTPKTTKKPNKKSKKKPVIGKKPQMKKNKPKQKINKKGTPKKISAVNKSKKPFQKKKGPPKMKGPKKNVKKGKKPITIKSKKGQNKKGKPMEHNDTVKYAKMILKKVMASVDKVVNDSKNKLTRNRSMPKQINKKNKKSQSKGVRKMTKWQPVKTRPNNRKRTRSRRKRQITKDSGDHIEKENIFKFLPKFVDIVFSPSRNHNETLKNERVISNTSNNDKYFEYNVDSKYDNKTIQKNKTEKQYIKSQMLVKSIDFETIQENNATLTDSVLESGYNKTRATPFIIDISDIVKANLSKISLNNTSSKKSQMVVKSNDFETIQENNATLTDSVLKSGYNKTRATPFIIDISDKVKASLSKISLNNTSSKKNNRCGQICQLKKAFKMMIGDNDSRIATKKKYNAKNKNLMSYIRNVFRRFFQTNTKRKKSVTKKPVYRKRNIVKNLCKNISPCNFDPLDKTLQSKLYQLKIESNKILKSVRIIKGVLKLFGDKKNYVIKNISSIDNNQQNKDIFILNEILKDRQNLANTFTNLTETQLKQIDYIRDNTKTFVQSIENFALILNDITKLLRNDDKKRLSRRTLRCTKKHQNESIKNSTVGEKIRKLKNLLISYNLVQNRFMKGMFDVLGTLEQTKPDIKKPAKVSDEIAKYNERLIIDNYTINIINNLRKLKGLAEKLSFKNRMKRSTMADENAVDYFLMLIEYLLKHNNLLDVKPASDGIDLLIEAIKNSPDIKPIPKTVLNSVPLQAIKTDISTPKSLLKPVYHSINNINETNVTLKANKVIKVFESLDEPSKATNIDDYLDKDYKKVVSEKEKKSFHDKPTINSVDLTSTIPNVYIAKDDEKMNGILDKFDSEKNEDKKGYEVFVDDTEEDDVIIITSNKPSEIDTEIPETQIIPMRTTLPPNINGIILKNALHTLKAIKKTNINWVAENLSREENNSYVFDTKEITTQSAIPAVTRTLKKTASRFSNPVSSMSRETEDERQEKTINPEYLMHKKQMNLLNSLDYETEKSVLDSDSKEEKYNSDSFPFM